MKTLDTLYPPEPHLVYTREAMERAFGYGRTGVGLAFIGTIIGRIESKARHDYGAGDLEKVVLVDTTDMEEAIRGYTDKMVKDVTG